MHPSISNGNSGGGGASGSSGGGTNEGSEAPPISGQGSGSPQQFCLRWNNYQSNLTNVFDQLLQNESFVDVTLACEGHSVKAHKIVLSACSPYFQALFTDNPCQHPIVILKDILWPELKAVIEFMYKGEINVNQEQIGPLLKVAESLKIRGLAEVNNEHDISPADGKSQNCQSLNSPLDSLKTPRSQSRASNPSRKRRRTSLERHSPESSMPESPSKALELLSSPISPPHQSPAPIQSQSQNSICSNLGPPANPLPLPPPQTPHQQQRDSMLDDLDIKPGIAEMIREEERAKMLESSHAWLGASTSSLPADSYQYQLQSIWQKCWNTNQSLVHNLRFRERGPLKSWRPETMAEAILSVLKDGLSLSQAARKFDIPYPTFVLYANRVHNMLGPSVDGGADLRPKGRGRPQRILLGLWPEDHIQTVIRAVVFRDPQHIKDEPSMALGYPRISEPLSLYSGCMNGPEPPGSPSSHTSTILAAAQSLRQQMLAASHSSDILPSLANGAPLIMGTPSPSPVNSSPPSSPVSNNNLEVGIGVSGVPYKPTNFSTSRPESLFQDDIEDLVIRNTPTSEGNKDQPLPLVIEQRSE